MGLEGKIGFPEEEEEEAGWDDGNIMCGYIISHNFPSYFLLKGEKGKSPPSRNIFWSSKLTCHQQTGLKKKRKKVPSWLLVFLERNAEKILRFPVVSPSVPQTLQIWKKKASYPARCPCWQLFSMSYLAGVYAEGRLLRWCYFSRYDSSIIQLLLLSFWPKRTLGLPPLKGKEKGSL